MLYTVSAVQILTTLDAWEEIEYHVPEAREKIGHRTWYA